MWPLSAAIASATQHQANPPHGGRAASEARPTLPNGEDAPLSPPDADSMPRIDWAEIALSNPLQHWLGMWEEGQVGDWLTVAFSQVGPLQMQLSSFVASDKRDDEPPRAQNDFPVPERMFNMRVTHPESGELVMSWRHVIDCHLRKYQLMDILHHDENGETRRDPSPPAAESVSRGNNWHVIFQLACDVRE